MARPEPVISTRPFDQITQKRPILPEPWAAVQHSPRTLWQECRTRIHEPAKNAPFEGARRIVHRPWDQIRVWTAIVNCRFTNDARYGAASTIVTIAHDLPPISAPLINHV